MTRRSLLNLIVPLALVAAPMGAQQPGQQAKPDSFAAAQDTPALIVQAQADGTTSGARIGAGGWFAGGFVSGLFLGLVGTGVTWALASYSEVKLPPDRQVIVGTQPGTYRHVYEKSFSDKVRMKRKSAALKGGLVGTGIVLAVFLSSWASSS
jgi:hypothetical protein